MRGKQGAGLNIGGSSILVIFVLLSLTTFATLAMVSSGASFRLAERVAAASDSFYAADSTAEIVLSRVSSAVRSAPFPDEAELEGNMSEFLADRLEGTPTGNSSGLMIIELGQGLWAISYSVPVDAFSALYVVLQLDLALQTIRVVEWAVVAYEFPEEYFTDTPAVWH